jgi:hypothetical protein
MNLTPEAAGKLAEEWIASWNSHDLDRILSHYDEAVEFRSPFVTRLLGDPSGAIRGKKNLKDYFARGLSSFPDLHFDLLQVLTGAGSVTLLYRGVRGLTVAEVMEMGESGRVVRASAHYSQETGPGVSGAQEER